MAVDYVAFMCYARFDDDQYDGQLTEFCARLAAEVKAQTAENFSIFQDRTDIAWGQNWRQRINETLDAVSLLLVIITPGLFSSVECRAEVARFVERERALGRSDLILPVYYIRTRQFEDDVLRETDALARVLAGRQWADWRRLRLEPSDSPEVIKAVAKLAERMTDTFWQRSTRPQPPKQSGQDKPVLPPAPRSWAQLPVPPRGTDLQLGATRSGAQPSAPAARPAEPRLVPAEPRLVPSEPAPYEAVPASRPAEPSTFLPPWPSPGSRPDTPANGGAPGRPRPLVPGLRWVPGWWQGHRTAFISVTLAVLLAVGGGSYALAARDNGPGLAATFTVPGNATVDSIWLSQDGKHMAVARTDQSSPIYIWSTADPNQQPTELRLPAMQVGTKTYPVLVENLAFSADDSSLTAVGFAQTSDPVGKHSYIMYRWDLATGSRTTLWDIVQTPSFLSLSQDNSVAVESGDGGAKLQTLLPKPSKTASPLTLPGGSNLTDTTTFNLDLDGGRMLYSPKRGTWVLWDFAAGRAVSTWTAPGLYFISTHGNTDIAFYYKYGAANQAGYPMPQLFDSATQANITPADPRWQEQLVTSPQQDAFVTYNTDGTVLTTKRSGGKTDLWNTVTSKFLLTITDQNYRDDSPFTVVGPHGGEVAIFGGRTTDTGDQYRKIYLWNTNLG